MIIFNLTSIIMAAKNSIKGVMSAITGLSKTSTPASTTPSESFRRITP